MAKSSTKTKFNKWIQEKYPEHPKLSVKEFDQLVVDSKKKKLTVHNYYIKNKGKKK